MKNLTLPSRLAAFTYVELMMVLGIIAVLLSLSVLSVGSLISKTNIATEAQMLLADTSSMQLKSMRREQGEGGQTTPFGLYFEAEEYVLFQGTVFDPSATENVTVPVPGDLYFSTISLAGNTIQFERGSGDVVSFNPSQASVVLSQEATGNSIVVQFNRHGVVELIR